MTMSSVLALGYDEVADDIVRYGARKCEGRGGGGHEDGDYGLGT